MSALFSKPPDDVAPVSSMPSASPSMDSPCRALRSDNQIRREQLRAGVSSTSVLTHGAASSASPNLRPSTDFLSLAASATQRGRREGVLGSYEGPAGGDHHRVLRQWQH